MDDKVIEHIIFGIVRVGGAVLAARLLGTDEIDAALLGAVGAGCLVGSVLFAQRKELRNDHPVHSSGNLPSIQLQ
jgi:hypothetical protein